jgi:leucyl aminopeptidase (aminopeptidase T)
MLIIFNLSDKRMENLYEFELGKASDILVRELFKLKKDETYLITADTESDLRVVKATAGAALAVGAKPMVIWIASPLGVGKAADPMLPLEPLTAALKEADAWVEFNNKWLLYSTPYDIAFKENKKLRHLCLAGMNVGMMIRCLGRINYPVLKKFQERIIELTKQAKHVKMTTPAGEEVEFDNDPKRPIISEDGYARVPGSHMMAGQIAWSPSFESIDGKIVFDGSVVPPHGLVKEPIRLFVKEGKIKRIEGGSEAREYERWLKSFNHPQMLKLAHVCYAFNPGAKLTGNIVEDERVWGATEWGIGQVGPKLAPPKGRVAPSHSDGICLDTSVWLDGKLLIDKGVVVHEELKKLAEKLGK